MFALLLRSLPLSYCRSRVIGSWIYPIYDPKTQKGAEFRVENAIAPQKRIVFKEILFLLEIHPIYDPRMRKDVEFCEDYESEAENAVALQKRCAFKEIRFFHAFSLNEYGFFTH